MFDRLQQFVFISLGFSSGFQISSLFLRLVYTYDASTSARHALLFLVLVSSRFTSGLCLCLCLRRTCKPAFNYPSLYVLDFSLELENE